MKIHMISLGCAKNLVDSEKILGILGRNGVSISALPDDCDAIIINTCGFIQPALAETEEEIERAVSVMAEKTRLFVFGCAVNRFGPELKARHPHVSGWFRLEERARLLESLHIDVPYPAVRLPTTHGYTYLKIAEGCSNNCSYCVIPMIRGPYRSIAYDALIHEARQLACLGFREIILIAQDTTRYGTDRHDRTMLPALIRGVSQIPSIQWIRIMYAHPETLSENIIREIEHNDKVCKYIDLPIQHISTRILHLMNRQKTKRELMALIHRLKEIKDISMRTTVITGFPGETDNEFKELVNFLNQNLFQWVGIFPYYREQGTPAADHDQVPEDVIQARYHELIELQQKLIARHNAKRINHEYDVLVDRVNARASGHTEFAAPEVDGEVIITGNDLRPGRFYRTRITGCEAHTLFGVPVLSDAA
jgi:ribosomal protein S12 methylthiotransferase